MEDAARQRLVQAGVVMTSIAGQLAGGLRKAKGGDKGIIYEKVSG
jgi:hypothetical protein